MLDFAIITNAGDRPVNEDSVGYGQNGNIYGFILCDGLGGHGMGDVASALAVGIFKNMLNGADDGVNLIGQAFSCAQEALLEEQVKQKAGKKMKTTAVALVTDEKNAYIGHIGDSRLYVFTGNRIRTRTLDHSIPQMLALAGQIKESEIRNHPDRNLVMRVIGTEWEEPMYELMAPIPLKKCDAFLLCSDGFWELIEEKDMKELLKKASSARDWLFNMADVVKKNGRGREMDNFSAIAVWNMAKRRK